MLLWRHSQALLKHFPRAFAASLNNVKIIFKKNVFVAEQQHI
jgi:hypothetical protein